MATITAGLLALLAAVLVASKQTKILEKQHQTLRQQIETDARIRENDIKLRLIDKRSLIISKLRDVQSAWLRQAELDDAAQRSLWTLIQDAELLFPCEATASLNDLASRQFEVRSAQRKAERLRREGKIEESEASLDEAMELEKRIFTGFPEALNLLIEHSAVRL